MTTTLVASKPAMVAEKKMRRGFRSHREEKIGIAKPNEF